MVFQILSHCRFLKDTAHSSLCCTCFLPILCVVETWVQSLGWEDPLEKDVATHFSILIWEILVRNSWLWGHKESGMAEQLMLSLFEGNTNCELTIPQFKKEKEYKVKTESLYRVVSDVPILNFWICWDLILYPLMENQNDGILQKERPWACTSQLPWLGVSVGWGTEAELVKRTISALKQILTWSQKTEFEFQTLIPLGGPKQDPQVPVSSSMK